jgi:filamentous hemagglutinin family protein
MMLFWFLMRGDKAAFAKYFAASLCLAPFIPMAAYAGGVLPSGGQFVAGSGTISQSGTTALIGQSSARGIINWQGFSIGGTNTVQFNNGNGATLNRVTGGNLSQIDGHLTATGTIYLINPSGIVFGPDGKVVTGGGFIASTRDEPNATFMAGGAQAFSGTSNGTVVNDGNMTAQNGDVVLIGHAASNRGNISAPNGTAALAAGNQILLQPAAGPAGIFVAPEIAGSGDVSNSGTVKAAAIALESAGGDVYALAGNNTGLIQATGTKTIAGQVWLTAPNGVTSIAGTVATQNADGSGGTIVATGAEVALASTAAVNANGIRGGKILLGGDRAGGKIASEKLVHETVTDSQSTTIATGAKVSADGSTGSGGDVVAWSNGTTTLNGTIAASGQTSGGYVETSGLRVVIGDNGGVSTKGVAKDGTWLIDPQNYTIAASGGDITGAQLSALLASNNIIIDSAQGAVAGSGDINVADAIAWSTAQTLTLDAYRNVNFNAGGVVTSTGGGAMEIHADDAATGIGTIIMNGGSISASGGGSVNFFYNPVSYTHPGTFADVSVSGATTFTAYMLVNTPLNFQSIAANLAGSYALNGNLNLSSVALAPIGSALTPFTGNFNGQAFTLSNAKITDATDMAVGIFGQNNGTITNLNLTGVSVTGNGGSSSHGTASRVGGLAGINAGAISDIKIDGDIIANNSLQDYSGPGTGLLVGLNTGLIAFSSSAGTVQGLGNVGGLVGWNNGSTAFIENSSSAATVQSDSKTAGGNATTYGGLVGWNEGGATIDNSYSAGTVNLTAGHPVLQKDIQTGGLVGSNASDFADYPSGIIESSYSIDPIIVAGTPLEVGGLVGRLGTAPGAIGTVSNSYWDIKTSGKSNGYAGTGLTDSQARDAANYQGFNFATTWAAGSASYPYPILVMPASTVSYYPVIVAGLSAQNKVYDGTDAATLIGTPVLTGVYPAEPSVSVTGSFTGSFVSPNAGNNIAVSYSPGFTLSGAQAGDYLIAGFTPIAADITPAPLAATIINDPTKVYDGTAIATLDSGNFQLTGFVAGQGAAVTATSGTYNSADVTVANTVTSGIAPSQFAADAGTSLANYYLPDSASGPGTITPAPLDALITGDPTKVEDGNNLATLTPADYTILGFVGGQGASITQTSGLYATANAGVQPVSAALASFDYAADAGTDLSNYSLPTNAAGLGTILGTTTAPNAAAFLNVVTLTSLVNSDNRPISSGSFSVLPAIVTADYAPPLHDNTWWFVFSPRHQLAVQGTAGTRPAIGAQIGVVSYNLLTNKGSLMVVPAPAAPAFQGATP